MPGEDADVVETALAPPNVMLYSHDTYGLGHLRRTLKLATFLRSRRRLSQLIVTGSPMAHRFELPADADYIKLPSVVKVARESYESRSLGLPFAAIRDLRRDLVLSAARHFRPRVCVVDNVPGGLKGEVVPALHYLKSVSCRLVLGLRDIVDESDRVRRTWAADESYELLDEAYDLILVYGAREIYDPVTEYGFSRQAAAKTRFVGYLGRERDGRGRGRIRRELGVGADQRLVLVMAGGGQDGYDLLRTFIDALRLDGDRAPFECLLVGGPLMPPGPQQELRDLALDRSARHVDFIDDVTSYVEAADAVVAMAGYNSLCELLSAGRPALIVPRVTPRREQLIRAEKLSGRGLLRMLHPSAVTARRLRAEVDRLLEEQSAPAVLPLTGLPRAADALDDLLEEAPVRAEPAGVGATVG